jgi:hypothetical protein
MSDIELVESVEPVFKEIKTANRKSYHRNYMKSYYQENKDHSKRLRNVSRIKKQYDISNDVSDKYGEYLYHVINLSILMKEMPEDLLNIYLNEYKELSLEKK